MRRKDTLPELLAPAGDMECLYAAVEAGADAIYVGGQAFGARAYAKNFTIEELRDAVTYCHLHGVRLYVTVNTLVLDSEMDSCVDFARELYALGVDAVIVADLGVVKRLRDEVPGLELHASTQMSVHNSLGADFAYGCGCERVVLARELSIENIRSVTQSCRCEVEVFLHGALCVCHSGQCLFSSLVGGRSGNRGECAQPCRLPYNNGEYALSLKDLSLARHVRELCESGVASLKIEGRMKSPDYVYTVTSIYRRLLDECRDANKEEYKLLERVFSRGGFTDGYFNGNRYTDMLGVRSEEDKHNSRIEAHGEFVPMRTELNAEVKIVLGEDSRIRLSYRAKNGHFLEATAVGPSAELARNAPLNPDDVKKRLSKMGNTYYTLDTDNISLELDEGVNLSPSAINGLRRDAVEALNELTRIGEGRYSEERSKIDTGAVKKCKEHINDRNKDLKIAYVYDANVLDELLCREEFNAYFDVVLAPLWKLSELDNAPNGVAIPPIVMEDELEEVREMLTEARTRGVKYALIQNVSHVALVKNMGFSLIGGTRLNVTNSSARDLLYKYIDGEIVVSSELTPVQVGELGLSAVVYGRIPLMLTERCFIKDTAGCNACSDYALRDRKNMKFPILREFRHRNQILNSTVTYMADKRGDLTRLWGEVYIFTTETSSEVLEIIHNYRHSLPLKNGAQFRRMGRRDFKK